MAGIWGYICSTGDSLKGWCWSAYGLGSAAVTKINDGRINATQKLSDEEFRAKIGPLTADLAKNGAIYACQEGLKSIPGGTLVYKTVSQSVRGEKKFESHGVDMKALQDRIAKLEEEAIKKSEGDLERAEKHQPCADLKSNAYYKKPEDVIRVFMMMESMGRQFLDYLMAPEVVRTRKNPK